MNIKITALIFTIAFMQLIQTAYSQSTYQFGGLPALNINRKLKNDWSVNTKIESRQVLQSGDFNGTVNKKFKYALTDFSVFTAKKVGLHSRIAGGYLLRVKDGVLFHRFMQQYTILQRMSGFRLAHRFLSDQTFSKSEKTEVRIRYRITTEIPLNGESIDPGEFYFKVNNEYLNRFQESDYDLEIRLAPVLGYDLTRRLKIETGPDYRVNSFINHSPRHSFWMSLNLFIEI